VPVICPTALEAPSNNDAMLGGKESSWNEASEAICLILLLADYEVFPM
jgi:hypothetical protein